MKQFVVNLELFKKVCKKHKTKKEWCDVCKEEKPISHFKFVQGIVKEYEDHWIFHGFSHCKNSDYSRGKR